MININSINDTSVQQIENLLTQIIKNTELKIDYSNLKQFLEQTLDNKNKVCTHFVDNTDITDSYGHDKTITISVLFSAMQCKSCNHLKEDHKACTKYFVEEYKPFSDDPCITCGLSVYEHECCVNYGGSDSTHCISCGRDLFAHQQKAKEMGKTHCGNFVKSDGFMDCTNCIYSESEHYLNPKLFTMNKDAYNKFTDLAFKFQTQYIGLSPSHMVENKDIFMKIMNMNYTKSHPLYRNYLNLGQPQV